MALSLTGLHAQEVISDTPAKPEAPKPKPEKERHDPGFTPWYLISPETRTQKMLAEIHNRDLEQKANLARRAVTISRDQFVKEEKVVAQQKTDALKAMSEKLDAEKAEQDKIDSYGWLMAILVRQFIAYSEMGKAMAMARKLEKSGPRPTLLGAILERVYGPPTK
jgi:hypothetical protein